MNSTLPAKGQGIAAEALLYSQQQQAALRDDQIAGQRLQQQVRPVTPWLTQGVKFEHCVIPGLYLSGDSIDYFTLPDGRILFYLADVSGSGTAAALVSMLLKSIVHEFILHTALPASDKPLLPSAVLSYLNQRLLSYNSDRHVTLICAIVDTAQNQLHWSLAGHLPSPILYQDGHASFLSGKGQPVGLFAQAQYQDQQMILPQAFSLSLFSDGVFDVLPEKSLVHSEAALPDLMRKAKGDYAKAIEALGLANCGNMPDDIAMLVLSRNLA